MIKAKKYRKKPVAVEAFQFNDETTVEDMPQWAVDAVNRGKLGYWFVRTLEGILVFTKNSYIVRGVKEELYPVRQDIFEETYEEVEDND